MAPTVDLLALSTKLQAGEHDFKQSVESALNQEANFRQAADASLAELEEYTSRKVWRSWRDLKPLQIEEKQNGRVK